MQPIALGFAVLGAFGYGTASVLQAIGAGRGAGALRTLAAPAYLAGLVLDLLAWLCSLVALRTLPVYEVQAILAGSLAVTVLLARVALAHHLRGRDLVAIAVTIGALIALAACSGPQQAADPSRPERLGLALAAVAVAGLGGLAVRAGRPGVTAATAGLAFGGAALCARAVTLPSIRAANLAHHLAATGADPLTWGLLGFGITGMVLYAYALEDGDVGPLTAVLWIGEVVAPSITGVLLLGDTVRPGWLPVAVIALGAAVGSAAVLTLPDEHQVNGPSSGAKRAAGETGTGRTR